MQETIENVIALGIILLLGSEGRDWEYYETDQDTLILKIIWSMN
ncbi:unnamed protein product [marine sediment metagenome]|uniref:Uncharacterized protein n=1 Tax=marine sediment metagenome TaxID=412755 RepID=X1TUI4_9ZZZZ